MIYVALGELLVILALLMLVKELVDRVQANATRMEMELLSVLGKTETVAISLQDTRPAGSVHYMDDAEAVKLEKRVNAS